MPKIFHRRSGSWTEVKSVFHKRNGAWTEVLNVFRKTSGSWVKVFAASKIPGNTVAPTITGSGYLFGTLTNTNLGTWTNTPTSYARQWRRGTPSSGGGEPTSYSNISGATSSTYVTTSSDNGKYVVCQVTATNAVGNNLAVSNSIYISKYAPVSLLPYTLSGTSTVGSTLTALEQIGSWKNTTTNTGDTYPDTFEYEWSYTDGTIIQSSTLSAGSYPRNINSDSLLIISADLNQQIRVRVTGTNTGGSATSGYTTSGTVTTVYSFAFGNTLYVGSNGYIGLDNGGTVAGTAGNGRNINIWNEDLVQYKLQEYSDSSNYHLYFRAYRYQSPLVRSAINALDYQIKFYTGQPYCDVYLVRKGSSVPTYIDNPGYYSNGLNGGTGIVGPFGWAAGSVLRVYFNGTLASTSAASWTAISDTVWKDITNSDIDDSFTSVVTSANQQAPTLTVPTIQSVSATVENAPVSVTFTGGGPAYQAYWTSGVAPTVPVTPDASGTNTTLTDNTGPINAGTYNMYVRSVATVGETSVGPSSVASAWSAGTQFIVATSAVTQNTAPNARATNTFSTSVVKYLDSITWTAGTYNNASSITSILLYSTSTSNISSPGGNTSTSTRASNPYVIQTSDPLGTPYIFAVRDTVVGTNGTTYYFYSNQITSALADAVAFSYGTATSVSGGWTASVNSGTQSGATYSYASATAGSGSVNSSTGAVTASGLSASQSSTITVNKDVSGYTLSTTTASGTASAPVKLSTPAGVSASDNRTDGINITWNAVSGASYYGVWWGGAPSYDSTPDFQNISGTSFLDSGAPVGSRNYYVQAFASGNPSGTKSDWGGPDSGTRLAVVAPLITSGPFISWGSGNNFTLSASASNATNLEFEVQFANANGGPVLRTQTFFFGASSGGGPTGAQANSWARTRVRANNTSTGLSSSFSGYSAWA